MKKSVKCAVLSVLMVCCLIFSLPLTTFAASREYSFNFNEPPTGEGQGYVLVEYVNTSTDKYYLQCFFWNSFLVGSSDIGAVDDTSMFITIKNDTISFAPIYQSEFSFAACFSYFMDYENALNRYYYREVTAPMQTIYSFTFGSAYDIVSFKCVGDFVSVETDIENRDTFNVAWGETALVLDELAVLISQMQESLANDEEALDLFNQILINTNDIEVILDIIQDKCNQIKNNTSTIISILRDIKDLLNSQGESTFEEPDTSGLNDYNNAEGELVSGADDTSDIEEEIGNFEIDVNASNSIWDIINRFLNSNSKVFGLAIGMLCLGIIALILNR